MLYLGLYDAAGRRLDGPLLISPDDAAHHLPATLGLAVGSGASLLADAAAAQGRAVEPALANLQPSAMALAEIALESGEESAVFRPLYLRPPDAKPQAQAIGRL
jgi:tRNA A37 threonylcarbamoyladenosine modification protein TsaB